MTNAGQLYKSVMEAVIETARVDFESEGVDEDVIDELHSLWEMKLMASGAIAPAEDRSDPPSAVGRNYSGQDLNVAYTPEDDEAFVGASANGAAALDEALSGRPEPYMSPPDHWESKPISSLHVTEAPGGTDRDSYGGAKGATKSSAKRKRDEVAVAVPQVDGAADDRAVEEAAAAGAGPHAAAGSGWAAKAADVADEVEAGTSRSAEDAQSAPARSPPRHVAQELRQLDEWERAKREFGRDRRLAAAAAAAAAASPRLGGGQVAVAEAAGDRCLPVGTIPQVDGGGDDDYGDGEYEEDYNSPFSPPPQTPAPPDLSAAEVPEADDNDEPPLGAEDDDDDDDDGAGGAGGDKIKGEEKEEQCANLVLCMYDKVTRVKNKWKCSLKDGVLHLNGRDVLFAKASGDFDF